MNDTQTKPLLSLLLILCATLALDQGTKHWASHALLKDGFHERTADLPVCGDASQEMTRDRMVQAERRSLTVIKGAFDFRYVENCNSGFSLTRGVPEWVRFPFFLGISFLAVFLLPYLYWRTAADQRLMLYALPFLFSGALGNLLDRLLHRYVIDFVHWHIKIGARTYSWPTFNIADVALVIGVALIVWQLLVHQRRKDPTAAG